VISRSRRPTWRWRPGRRVDPARDDPGGLDAHDGVLEPLAERLTAGRDHRRGPANLDHPGLPRRADIVDDDACPAGAPHVPELLGLAHPHAAHIDGVVVGVVPERRGHHVGLPILPTVAIRPCRGPAR
jgi:hypothetical protein